MTLARELVGSLAALILGMGVAGAVSVVSGEDRVKEAYSLKKPAVEALTKKAGLDYPVPHLFFRAFKRERVLEVWGAEAEAGPYKLIHTYSIAGMSGTLGPKRREGDRQVPEGFYVIDRFNPQSRFLLSLGINYPNASDRVLSDRERPGSDIFIHGDTRSIGCLAMTDDKIREIYIFASEARKAGNDDIPVHIFPCRLDKRGLAILAKEYQREPEMIEFWEILKPIYDAFEEKRRIPRVTVGKDGRYALAK